MRRRPGALLALAAGILIGLALFRRLGAGPRAERVDLYYDDGSLVTLGDEEAAPLLDVARTALRSTLP
jgi:hypothetical protein